MHTTSAPSTHTTSTRTASMRTTSMHTTSAPSIYYSGAAACCWPTHHALQPCMHQHAICCWQCCRRPTPTAGAGCLGTQQGRAGGGVMASYPGNPALDAASLVHRLLCNARPMSPANGHLQTYQLQKQTAQLPALGCCHPQMPAAFCRALGIVYLTTAPYGACATADAQFIDGLIGC